MWATNTQASNGPDDYDELGASPGPPLAVQGVRRHGIIVQRRPRDRRGIGQIPNHEYLPGRATLTALPAREDLTLPIREQLIVELYSR